MSVSPCSRHARTRCLSRLIAATMTLLVGCILAHAQTTSPSPRQTPPAPAAKPAVAAPTNADSATRARRAAPVGNEVVVANSDAPAPQVDELAALRDQIKLTSEPGERARLQRDLLERLAAVSDKAAALDELRLLLHEDRFDPPFFYNLGNALARTGDASAATDAYRKAISQRRGHYARALNNLGVILTRQGRWDEAHDALTAALNEEHNTYAEASYNLGRLYLLRGEVDLAIRHWRRTLALQPEHADAAAALARAYAEDGDPQRGLAVLDAYAARSTRTGEGVPLPVVHARRELVAWDTSATNEASARHVELTNSEVTRTGARVTASDTNTSAALSSNNMRAERSQSGRASVGARARPLALDAQTHDLLQRARAAREAGQHDAAVRAYRDVLAHSNGYFPPANLELAFSLISLRRNDEAIATLTALVARDDARYPVAHYHLGRLYEQSGQFERAANSFARAAALYGDTNPQALLDLSRVREKAGDNASALAALEAYVKLMAQQGVAPVWAEERLTKLRAKTTATP